MISLAETSLLKTIVSLFNYDDNFFCVPWINNTNIFVISDNIEQTALFSVHQDRFPNIRDIVFAMGSTSDQFFSALYFDLFTYNDIAKVCSVAMLTSLLVSSDSLFRTFYNNILDKYNWEQSIFLVKYLRWTKRVNYDISDFVVTKTPLTSMYGEINDDVFILGAGFYIPFNVIEQYLLQYLQFYLHTNYSVNDITIPIFKYILPSIIQPSVSWNVYPMYIFYIPQVLLDNVFNFDIQEIDTSILNSISKHYSILNISEQNKSVVDDTIDSIGHEYFINTSVGDKYSTVFTNSYIISAYNINEVDTDFTTDIILDKFEQFSINDSQYSTSINY